MISSVNQLVGSEDKNWHQTSSVIRDERLGQRQIRVIESRLKGNKESLLVWQWYWINDQAIVNLYQGKMLQAKEKLLMQGDDSAALFFYAGYQDNPDAARATLREFLSTHLNKLESRLIQSKQTQSN